MARRRRIVLWVVAAVLAVPVVLAAMLYASLSGGWDDAFRPKKTESSRDVRAAREKAEPKLRERTAGLPGTFGPSANECDEGQHNWKVDDDYDVACELLTTSVSREPVAAFRERTRALHETLTRAGWRPTGSFGLPEVMRTYERAEVRARGVGSLSTAEYERDDALLTVSWADAKNPTPRYGGDVRVGDGEYAAVLTVRLPYYKG